MDLKKRLINRKAVSVTRSRSRFPEEGKSMCTLFYTTSGAVKSVKEWYHPNCNKFQDCINKLLKYKNNEKFTVINYPFYRKSTEATNQWHKRSKKVELCS